MPDRRNKDDIIREARSQFRGKPLVGALAIEVTFFLDDPRKHDWDNIKALLGALNGIIWHDGRQIKNAHITAEYDAENPRVEVRVWEATFAG